VALEGEGDGGSDEVDEEEAKEVDQQLSKLAAERLQVVVEINEVGDDAQRNIRSMNGETRQEHLEDENVGEGKESHGLVADDMRRDASRRPGACRRTNGSAGA